MYSMHGAVFNDGVVFIGGNHLACCLSGDDPQAAVDEKKDDKPLEAYQAAYAKYKKDWVKLLDWIETQHENKKVTKQNFTNTDYALKFFKPMHQDELLTAPSEPKFSDFYQPSALQKRGELIFVGTILETKPISKNLKILSFSHFFLPFLSNSFFNLFLTLKTSIGQKPNFRFPAQP